MKKFLVVLLILAVAGGVFALDGEWSLGASAEVGTIMDFDPTPGVDADTTITGTQYNRPYSNWDYPKGQLSMNYNMGGFSAGVSFSSLNDQLIYGQVGYGGDNYYFHAGSDLGSLVNQNPSMHNLWGNYGFVNGMVLLEASYARGWAGNAFWASDTTGAFKDWNGYGGNPLFGVWDGRNTFTMTDGDQSSNYLVADVRMAGLSFGMKLRDLFWYPGQAGWIVGGNATQNLVDDVLKKLIIGVKFNMSPVEFAAQFLMEEYGVYFGGKWYVGPITVGLSFMGLMDDPNDDQGTRIKVGAAVDYAADSFGVGIKGMLGVYGNKTLAGGIGGASDAARVNEIGVEPYFYFNVIPTHLRFQTDIGFYFFSGYQTGATEKEDLLVRWALQPQLFWNFLGTGAGGYGGTGISVRYRMVSGNGAAAVNLFEQFIEGNAFGANNKLDICFRLSM